MKAVKHFVLCNNIPCVLYKFVQGSDDAVEHTESLGLWILSIVRNSK
jgi:hypothetical protein